jgi:hypothetical protein
MDTRYPNDRIVGWYHSHPGFGIFLSEMDQFIHDNFFNEAWQIAYVDDPIDGDRGVFVWEKGAAVRRDYLLESKSMRTAMQTAADTAPAADAKPAGPQPIGADSHAGKTDYHPKKAVSSVDIRRIGLARHSHGGPVLDGDYFHGPGQGLQGIQMGRGTAGKNFDRHSRAAITQWPSSRSTSPGTI